jgi:hypothetical protein
MIEVIKTPEISLNECALCDTILVTYTLVGEEPVTVEVEKESDLVDGKVHYLFTQDIGFEVTFHIFWSTDDNRWVFFYEGVLQATLTEDTPCPFGTYTIEEGSDFEAFEVQPSECYTSKWSAVHHPIKWELQRKDAEVITTSLATGGFTGKFRLELSATPPTGVVVGLEIDFYDSLAVKRSGTILDVTGNFLIVSNNYVLGVVVEFVIFPTLYNNYYIETDVENIGTIRTIPNPQGKATIDVSAWLRTQTAFDNTYNYTSLTAVDLGQSGSYRLRFRENYNFQIGTFGSYTSKFYWSNSAKQIRDAYGINMIEYVTNLNTPVKFLSVFNRPTNFLGFPFSLSWINGGDYTKLIRKNENSGTYTSLGSITSGSGAVNRLKVSDACESVLIEYGIPDFLGAFFKQGDLTETKQIKINQTCLERPLAVSWLNTLGGREHWVFSYNQIHTLDTQSGATYQPNIDNLETATSNIFDLQKFAQPKISVGANVDIEDIEGLKSILYSICIEIETAKGWIGVRVETGSFKILETKDTKATIEMTFVLPDINIQTR